MSNALSVEKKPETGPGCSWGKRCAVFLLFATFLLYNLHRRGLRTFHPALALPTRSERMRNDLYNSNSCVIEMWNDSSSGN